MKDKRVKRKTWTENDTWRSVAFNLYRDSRQWRYLMALNPSYDIRTHPAPGVKFNTWGPVPSGVEIPESAGRKGLLKMVDTNLDLRANPFSDNADSLSENIWPWSSADMYFNRLGEHTAAALFEKDRVNGYSIDSPQASSDSQRVN